MRKIFKRHKNTTALPFSKLFPSVLTIIALCAGLTAIKYALEGKFEHCVALIVISAFLDAMDGRLARYLNATSEFGANLDSLADFLNFGVAPSVSLYIWTLQYTPVKGLGWIVVLIFSVCMSIRLARFNASATNPKIDKLKDVFFSGISAPCGGVLALVPMMLTFEFDDISRLINPFSVAIYSTLIAFGMASRIPTISIKKMQIPHENVALVLAFSGLLIAALLMKPWIIIPALGLIYVISIPVTTFMYYSKKAALALEQ